ncbi:hypothetical protein A8709_14580 [Paenibacillus pectinilyticus]|uniref:DNA-binding response regulator n=1 Tax=Paenibacillus pectinilyticus TaxID=512399 RepID=A0A1C1A430_9BACL|nr:response regulator [Paenibacillus pectinilyticus]OCT15317.1 hypothetical protein A8709_14580 [Paenibacillus pectinilyticus]
MLNAMIVEDNAIYRYAITSILRWEDYGFQIVCEALNGVHALDLMQHQHVDLIITDISMPEMNGIELIQQVKRKNASIKIVALSSYDDFRFVKEALKLGAEDYLLKHDLQPENLQQILELMKVKIDADHEFQKQGSIREANLQEMRCLLGRKLLLNEIKTVKEMEDHAIAVQFPFGGDPIVAMLFDGYYNHSANLPSIEVEHDLISMAIPMTNQRTVVMTSFTHEKSERACIEEALRQASFAVNRSSKENGTLTVGVSAVGYGLKEWSMVYRQAESALEQKVYEGSGQIYAYSAKSVQDRVSIQSNFSIQPLAVALKSGQLTEAEAQIELLFQYLQQRKPSLSELRGHLTEVAILMKTIGLERSQFSDNMEHIMKQIIQDSEELPALVKMKHLLLELQRGILEPRTWEKTKIRKEIQAAISYIEEHCTEDITLAQLAEVLHLSGNYLSNLFKSETGMRIVEYMNRCRIHKAKHLLRDPSLKVYEVAEKTGFQEASYFCKVFKELEGKTVREFRSEK